MKVETMKTLFRANAIRGVRITPSVMKESKWNLQFEANQDLWKTEVLESRRGRVRDFASIEAVINVLKDVGVKETTIQVF